MIIQALQVPLLHDLQSLSDYPSGLNDFIEFLGLKGKFNVAGHSTIGSILLQYLLDYPDRIDGDVVVNSFTSGA
jgi:pimeloyl-ACP methyl ester carboxylesterase